MNKKKKGLIKAIGGMFALALTISATPTQTTAASVVPTGATQYNGHTYYVFKGNVSWSKAKTECEKRGGHLATVTSAGENDFVTSLISQGVRGKCWLGASDTETEGTWKWVTGERFDYTSWAYGQPDSYSDGENYLETYFYGNDEWNDAIIKTEDICGYVCEWDMTKSAAKKTRINVKKTDLYYKSSVTLKVVNNSKKVKWSSSNKKVATVNSKGKVTGVKPGKATITAKIGKKKYKCTIKVKERNAKASTSFTVSGGGNFIAKENSAIAKFKLTDYSCSNVKVSIVNSAGSTVYSKKYSNVKKGKWLQFNWNGKNSKGAYVPAGNYRVVVKCGTKSSYSPYLKFIRDNEFNGGIGTQSKPYLVANETQFRKIVKYPNAHFKQVADLNFDYTAMGNLFVADENLGGAFNGTYDGNNKKISCISANAALFDTLGAKGVIKNLVMENCSVVAQNGALLVTDNYGKIENCSISGTVSGGYKEDVYMGIISTFNYGTISNCKAYGSVTGKTEGYHNYAYIGAIVSQNKESGKILDSICNVDVVSLCIYYCGAYAGGVVSENFGMIVGCEGEGSVSAKETQYGSTEKIRIGGLAAYNSGQILSSSYTGPTISKLIGLDEGVCA